MLPAAQPRACVVAVQLEFEVQGSGGGHLQRRQAQESPGDGVAADAAGKVALVVLQKDERRTGRRCW